MLEKEISMEWLTSSYCLDKVKQNAAKKKARDSLKFSFHSLATLPPTVMVFDRAIIDVSDKVWRTSKLIASIILVFED